MCLTRQKSTLCNQIEFFFFCSCVLSHVNWVLLCCFFFFLRQSFFSSFHCKAHFIPSFMFIDKARHCACCRLRAKKKQQRPNTHSGPFPSFAPYHVCISIDKRKFALTPSFKHYVVNMENYHSNRFNLIVLEKLTFFMNNVICICKTMKKKYGLNHWNMKDQQQQ